jgi:exodeoxyribonuclease-3
MVKIISWNVNSVRSRVENLLKVINRWNPDVLLLQELKCMDEQFPFSEFEHLNYNIEVAGQKGRNGVAIMSKFPLYDVRRGLPLYGMVEEDGDARFLEARIDVEGTSIKIAGIYAPNGGPSVLDIRNGAKEITETQTFFNKMKFFDRLRTKFEEEIKNDEISFFCADYNVCPNLHMDVYSPSKDGTITNTQQERDKFRELLEVGMTDSWRELNPTARDYSWWGYRPFTMFEKNQGYRLDTLLTTPKARELVKSCEILREVRGQDKPSDHAPFMFEV